ncbi:MAG: RNA polymerase sigma factor [Defluviitaleaceae bacterium]|nr:RNA polymerase sigma factor [Defluviitaleaceae bacterium]
MTTSLQRTGKEIAEIYERHKDMVYRICFAYMKSNTDTEDAVQDTFCNLIKGAKPFESYEHEKAWLIRTATNVCKNSVKHWWRKRENLEDYENHRSPDVFEIDETFQVVMGLPRKYKTVVYLYYYEGYDSAEIAQILQKPQSTIRYYLSQARKILREKIGGDENAQ